MDDLTRAALTATLPPGWRLFDFDGIVVMRDDESDGYLVEVHSPSARSRAILTIPAAKATPELLPGFLTEAAHERLAR